ncbi:type I glyceraldehyde-3-phosphate dehydrogenase [Jiangella muralis]|uniref:type I glyceraldehyde-3-phosphate dehydrogenase n=1 Tax=Jiangella muralis TaxID=702383 RepID=UPI00069DFCD6|nr:type I glyceraldehyde-3-phosphate dehydrogenase [Jiangella muralis]
MTVRVGINGFGRIGRTYLRNVLDRDIDVVAVNDITDAETLAHLLAYDSTYGRLAQTVDHDDTSLTVDRHQIAVLSQREPDRLPWGELGVDIVVEASGRFRTRDEAAAHLKAGARKVLLSAPGKGVDATVVMGVNEGVYDPRAHDVVSNASCTTNCVVPMVKVLHDSFGITKGFMTTIHAYTGDQRLLDSPHKDLRRARSAAVNIIPTSTGAARSVGLVIPEMAGQLDGLSLRVPVEVGSLVDLAVVLDRAVTVADVNAAFEAAATTAPLAGILAYTTRPIVSRDIIGDPASCVFDASLTEASGDLVKVFGWYDNEWAFSARLADLTEYMADRL